MNKNGYFFSNFCQICTKKTPIMANINATIGNMTKYVLFFWKKYQIWTVLLTEWIFILSTVLFILFTEAHQKIHFEIKYCIPKLPKLHMIQSYRSYISCQGFFFTPNILSSLIRYVFSAILPIDSYYFKKSFVQKVEKKNWGIDKTE